MLLKRVRETYYRAIQFKDRNDSESTQRDIE